MTSVHVPAQNSLGRGRRTPDQESEAGTNAQTLRGTPARPACWNSTRPGKGAQRVHPCRRDRALGTRVSVKGAGQTQVFGFSQMLEQLTARDWQGEGSLFHPKISCVGRWERPRGCEWLQNSENVLEAETGGLPGVGVKPGAPLGAAWGTENLSHTKRQTDRQTGVRGQRRGGWGVWGRGLASTSQWLRGQVQGKNRIRTRLA